MWVMYVLLFLLLFLFPCFWVKQISSTQMEI
uniref:Uncharacterized protein n=1 Tax=Rhizophora mucronata TaxID=61149 RepID=A0A2P2R1J4_RHIMU